MIILGIDPGTKRVGYGVIQSERGKCRFVDAGILAVNGANGPEGLSEIKKQIEALIEKHKPGIFGIEKLYFAKNRKTALAVAEARGAMLLVALTHGLEIKELNPNEVKSGISGYGFADKKAVLKMVRLILGVPELDVIDDASDALAIAIVASNQKYTA